MINMKKPFNWYMFGGLVGLLSFIILNRVCNGYFFEEIFYGLTGDTIFDFFVFLNQNSTSPVAFTTGSNPPLVRIIFRFIFKSLPESIQNMYPSVNLSPYGAYDIRMNSFAFLSFWVMFTITIISIAKMCHERIEGSKFQKNLFVGLMTFSTGIIWSIERGNIVIIAMACTMYFCFNYESLETRCKEISYLLLGVAISLKIYPVLFCLLLLKKKDYKSIVKVGIYVSILTILPLLLTGGMNTVFGYIGSLFNQVSSESNLRVGYLNGLSIMYTIFRLLGIESIFLDNIWVFRVINYCVCLLMSVLSVYFVKKKWVTILTLVFAMFLLPGITHTYMLCFVLIPLVMFVNEENTINVETVLTIIGFILLTTLLPIKNGIIVEMLRTETGINVANRLTGLMLIHIVGELMLSCVILYEQIGAFRKYIVNNLHKSNNGV